MDKFTFLAQHMSDYSKKESQFSSVNKYNGYLTDEVNKFNADGARIKLMFADYNAALQDEKQQLQYQNILGAYLQKLDLYSTMVKNDIIKLATQIQAKKYPLSTDSNVTVKTVGQLAIANAISIFALSVNDASIRAAFVYNADKFTTTGQFDFYSTLLELELGRSQKNADENQNINDTKKQYFQYLKVTPMLAESLELSRVLDDIQWQRTIQSVTTRGSADFADAVGGMMKDRQLSAALAELQ
jgi:cell division septum initiation protein DivIVA